MHQRLIPLLALATLLGACGGPAGDDDPASEIAVQDTVTPAAVEAPTTPVSRMPSPLRGIYLNAYAAGSRNRLGQLIALADSTEINAFVIDVKDERGIRYRSEIELANELAQPGEVTIRDLSALADTLKAHGIWTIARIVVFKDPLLAAARPDWAIQRPGGGVWTDRAGNHWVSPWDDRVWEHNLAIAEEVVRAGFDEVQFDYVRFPEPYRRTLPAQVHPRAQGDRTDAIAAFLNRAKERLHPLGAPVSADLFGLVPNTPDDLDIGQQWETLVAVADVVLPMVYPSHYLPTHLPGVSTPNRMPYETVYTSMAMATIRNNRLRESGVEPARVVVWLQAFNAPWVDRGNPFPYEAQQLRDQVRGVYDAGLDDWVLWHPGSRYGPMEAGLERTAESRAREFNPSPELVAYVDRWERQGVADARERAARQAAGRTSDPEAAREARTGED
jgi:hypothetical protein